MVLASIESVMGSLWFAGLALVVGYVAGQIFPIGALSDLFKKK